jgi:hypothetical protein
MPGLLIHGRKSSDGLSKPLDCGDGGELKVILCGVQPDGTVTPLQCDADGKLVTTS